MKDGLFHGCFCKKWNERASAGMGQPLLTPSKLCFVSHGQPVHKVDCGLLPFYNYIHHNWFVLHTAVDHSFPQYQYCKLIILVASDYPHGPWQ